MLIVNSIGETLKESRERSNLTQQELANMSYLSRQTISKYELDVSQISVEKFMMLLDIMGASVLLKDGKITIMEVKNMETFGYLKINAIIAKAISSDIEKASEIFKKNGVDLVNLFELNEHIKSCNEDRATLDSGFYITVDFKKTNIEQKYIEDPYCDGYDNSPIESLLLKIQNSLGVKSSYMENIIFVMYHPISNYKNVNPEKISFKDIDLINAKLKSLHTNFNPGEYDVIFPNPRAGYLRVKKDGKYGFIDYRTGKEMVPCKFDFVEAFDYFMRDENGEMYCRGRLNGDNVRIKRNGYIY